VLYDTNAQIDAANGIEGFGQAAPEAYDTEYSNLTNGSGYQVDPQTGQLYDPVTGTEVSGSINPYNNNPNYANQYYAYNNYNSSTPNSLTDAQLAAIMDSNSVVPANADYLFPMANPMPVVYSDFGAVPVSGQYVYSDGQLVYSPAQLDTLYPSSSWQRSMYLKGYSPDQINSASVYINSSTPAAGVNLQQLAQNYVRNPNSSKLANSPKPTFGQPATTPTKINFSNPTASTQPVYNSQDWQYQLSTQGYTKAEIDTAARFLSNVKITPGANLTNIAATYIKNSKSSGATGITKPVETTVQTTVSSTLPGPSYNPIGGTGNNPYTVI
jgi:hypothetical protein